MSTCNFTQLIRASECIGDSLVKITDNFTNLDNAVCSLYTTTALALSSLSAVSTPTISLAYNTNAKALSANLQTASVTSQFIALSAITTTLIANSAVTDVKIRHGAVTSQKLADNSVSNAKLGLSSVSTDRIQNYAISPIKLSLGGPVWTTSGYVGIGITLPESSLHVVGGVLARSGTPGANGISNNGYAFADDGDSGMYSTANGRIEFYNNNVEVMRLQTGNVGIGTTSPTSKLHVNGSGSLARFTGSGVTYSGLDLRLTDASASLQRGSQIITTNESGITTSYYAVLLNTDGSSNIIITTTPPGARTSDRQVERLRITGAGDVGIGTAAPAYKLDVTGSIRATVGAYLNTLPSRALISDSTGKVESSVVTSTQLACLSSATSDVQVQINTKVAANPAIAAGTNTKITYDSKGLVTAGSNLQATDLPAHVIATNTGLGGQHTISGATAGQVLRATGATTAAFQLLIASDIPNLDALKITTGTFDADRIPSLDAAKTTTGTFNAARIPNLDATKITTGTLNVDRVPNLDTSKVTTGTFNLGRIPDLDAIKITTGTLNIERVPSIPSGKLTAGGPTWNSSGTVTATTFVGNGTIPIGGIIMWSGTLAAIPLGWALCNGSSGTPDLRERFIVGAGGDNPSVNGSTGYNPGNTGGDNTVTLTVNQIPSHNHDGITGVDSPDHTHTSSFIRDRSSGATGNAVLGDENYYGNQFVTSGGASTRHQHSIPSQGGSQSHENRPPYYALAFIMRVA